jgi:hypothetical protein
MMRHHDRYRKTPWIRLRAVRPLLEWFTQAALIECALAVHVLSDDMLADRGALTAYLSEQVLNLCRRKAKDLETHWEAEWGKEMAGKSVDLPNIQN